MSSLGSPVVANMSAYAYPSSTGDRSSRYGSSDDAQSVRDGSQTGSSSTRREQLPPITSLLGAAASSVRPMHSPRSERPSEPYSRGSPLDHHHHHQPPTSVPLERSHSGSSYFPPTVSPQPSQPPRSNYDSRHSSLDRGPYQPSQQPPPSRPLHSGPSSPRLRGGEADYHHQQHQHHQPPPPPAAYHHSNGISGSNSTSLPPLPPHHQQPPLPPPPSDYASSKWSVQHDLKSDYAAASNQIFGTYRAPHERVPVYVSGHGHQQHPPPSAPYDQDSAYGGTASSGGSVAGGPPASVYGGGVLQPPPTPSTTATTGSLSETGAAGGGGGPGGATATSAASPGTGSVGQPVKDALGPKIWTGSHFLPRFVRQAEVPGEGMCYFYDDGSHCKTVIDGEAVNAHWGVTKAGKPRKRLAIACITCREKKIKCDPDYPRCLQCEKFGRVCQFKNA